MKTLRYSFAVLLLTLLFTGPGAGLSFAQDKTEEFRSTDLPLPRFVSLRSDKVYVRAGPALRYPIKWVFKRADMPVEITQEFDNWRKIKDYEGESGWIHQSLLSGERHVLVMGQDLAPVHEGFSRDSRMVARLEPMVVARLDRCIPEWCRVDVGGYRGWIERNLIWGIYENEYLD